MFCILGFIKGWDVSVPISVSDEPLFLGIVGMDFWHYLCIWIF